MRKIATEEARGLGVEGFAVAPSAIDTPMTRHEAILGMLLLGAARTFGGNAKHPLNNEVLALAGIRACTTPNVVLKALLGPALTGTDEFKIVAETFEKDPLLAMGGVLRFVGYLNPKGADGQRHVRPEVIARSAEILTKLDVVIGPEIVGGQEQRLVVWNRRRMQGHAWSRRPSSSADRLTRSLRRPSRVSSDSLSVRTALSASLTERSTWRSAQTFTRDTPFSFSQPISPAASTCSSSF